MFVIMGFGAFLWFPLGLMKSWYKGNATTELYDVNVHHGGLCLDVTSAYSALQPCVAHHCYLQHIYMDSFSKTGLVYKKQISTGHLKSLCNTIGSR